MRRGECLEHLVKIVYLINTSHTEMECFLTRRSVSCVKCQVFQPPGGKLLDCAHVICEGCAREDTADTNTIQCARCDARTEPRKVGVSIVQQLLSCRPLFIRSRDTAHSIDSTDSRSDGEVTLLREMCKDCAAHPYNPCSRVTLCKDHSGIQSGAVLPTDHQPEEPVRSQQPTNGSEDVKSSSGKSQPHKQRTPGMSSASSFPDECWSTEHHSPAIESGAASRRLSLMHEMDQSRTSLLGEDLAWTDNMPAAEKIASEITSMIISLDAEIEAIRDEGQKASMAVTSTYECIADMLRTARCQNLLELDALHENQRRLNTEKQTILWELNEERPSTAQPCDFSIAVDTSTTEPKQQAQDIRISPTHMSADYEAQIHETRCLIVTADTCDEKVRAAEDAIQSVIRVAGVDASKIRLSLPEKVFVGKSYFVKTTFPRPLTEAIRNLTLSLVYPSDKRQDITEHLDLTSSEVSMTAKLACTELGSYALEICHFGNLLRVERFSCIPPAALFDPKKCAIHITLSEGNQVATHTGNVDHWCVVATAEGYTKGTHEWTATFANANADGHFLMAGVMALPIDKRYDTNDPFFNSSCYYCWTTNGRCWRSNPKTSSSCTPFSDGDMATFILDCDAGTLEIHHRRAKEMRVITNVRCDEPLYPAFSFYAPGHKVVLN